MNDPVTTLRWVRWLQVGMGVFALALAALKWSTDDGLWWLLAAAGALLLIGSLGFGPAIRQAERQGPPTDPAARLRRGQRGAIGCSA